MKKIKSIIISVLVISSIVVLAQAVKQDINSSVGTGDAMKFNLNEPNATSPASNNIQKYEKDGVMVDKNDHPEKSLSNSYNRSSYEGTKK